jgi:NTP pyrophosphatase (non-canonical NTP hydrolase)
MQPRKEVRVFAALMEHKLKKNDHKPNFENTDINYLLERLKEEVQELHEAVANESWFEVMLEAADVANFACIIVWNILRNQVIGELNTTQLKMPECDCSHETTQTHHHNCAIRVWFRDNCNCLANGELEKTHTVFCNTNMETKNA